MAKRFLPLKAETKFDEFYAILMSGDGIRKDNGAHDYYDIIPRERISVTNERTEEGRVYRPRKTEQRRVHW